MADDNKNNDSGLLVEGKQRKRTVYNPFGEKQGMIDVKVAKFLFTIMVILLVACGDKIDANMAEPMAEFTTQDEELLNLDDFKGEWWIDNLMYTNCNKICPRTTANLADV